MNNGNPETKKAAGTGVGAGGGAAAGGVVGGATAGALAGGVTGPVGAAIGAAVGAVAGAVMGKKAADPVTEESYWRENHATRPYARKDVGWDHYQPAYRAGVESYNRSPGRSFDEVERSNALVHVVGVRSDDRAPDAPEPEHLRVLGQIAAATGGRLWQAESPQRLQKAFAAIVAAMNTRYLLRFEPGSGPPVGWHEIELRLRGAKGDVHARRGYFRRAPAPRPD